MSLTLNFSPILFEDAEIEAGVFPYSATGDHTVDELRRAHWATHVFRRDGASEIVAVPIAANAPALGERTKRIRLSKNLGLTAALIRDSLITYLADLPRAVLHYEPIRFIAQDNILRSSVPAGLDCPEWVSVRSLYELAVRPVYFFKREPFIACIVDVRTTRILSRTVAQLLTDGFSPVGHYVTVQQTTHDPRIAPRHELLGRVQAVSGTTLKLTDAKDDLASIDASEVSLEKRVFGAYLAHVFKNKTDLVVSSLERARADLRSGPTRLKRITTIVDFFASKRHLLAPGIEFRFSPLIDSNTRKFLPSLETVPKPTYVYDQTGTKTDSWNDGGLNKNGPYSAKVFTPNKPRLCVVCQKTQKGRVEQFLHKFINGVTLPAPPPGYQGKAPRNYFEKGFLRKYSLQDVTYEFFLAEDSSAGSYRDACRRALDKHGSGTRWDLALVQIEESFHELSANQNPYFVTKDSFLTHQIPVQEFEIETAQKPDRELHFSLNNMALAVYAKLNGIPWLLKANPTIAHELVIGLGSANVSEGRFGDRERYVGITTVFSGDGNYHLTNASKAVKMMNYRAAFLDTLRQAVFRVRQDMNWQPKDHVRLVFHASFKKFSADEIAAVKAVMEELGEYEVEYAFVQLSDEHPYLLLNTDEKGVRDYETRETKGVYAPRRGSALQLANHDVLLTLVGPSEVKRPEDGLPHPLLLTLHRDSTFTDVTYLTRQVFAFACHSWRTFLPGRLPVTIQYSDLIAKALGNLARLDRWNPDVMLGRIGKSRWFL